MSAWQLTLDDANGGLLADLEAFATARKFARTRNDASVVEFTLSLLAPGNEAALALLAGMTGIPRVRVYQDGELRFHTRWVAMKESADSSGATLACTFKSPFGAVLLGDGSSTGRFTSQTFTALDQGQIVKQMIDAQNAVSETGIDTTGVIEATAAQTIAYDRKNVGQATQELSQSSPGFDFAELPREDGGTGKLVTLEIYAQQGVVRDSATSAMFQHGPATLDNVLSVGRTWQPPANDVLVIGASGLIGTASDQASIDSFGDWPLQISAVNVDDQTLLDELASAHLRSNPIRVVSFQPDPASAPVPFVDYDVGDTVGLYASRDGLQINAPVRVDSISVELNDDGVESAHTVTVEEVA